MVPNKAYLIVSVGLVFLVTLVASQGTNYARESDENIDWMARGASIARNWNEAILYAIRRDNTRPPIHARNLFHLSVVIYDSWAAYQDGPRQYMHQEKVTTKFETEDARIAAINQTISYACYKLLRHRFVRANNVTAAFNEFDRKMNLLGYDKAFNDTTGTSAASLGLRIATTLIDNTYNDGANEENDYAGEPFYNPVNKPLWPGRDGNPLLYITDPNRWQPLTLGNFVDQNGVESSNYPAFVGPHWGFVTPFALTEAERSPHKPGVWLDPGDPPRVDLLGAYKPTTPDQIHYTMNHTRVAIFSSYLDPTDGEMMDISPGNLGNNTLGTNDGHGYSVNPKTGKPYEPQIVPRGDYYRVLAEFWADGPHSETPPGHWNVVLNYVSYHPETVRRFNGQGKILDPLEWDVKAYMTLNGAMHDAAIACWGAKGYYDSSRPISAIRYMAERGQQSNNSAWLINQKVRYSSHGLPIIPGLVEPITTITTGCIGCKHAHLLSYTGEMAIKAWRGPAYINSSLTSNRGFAGVGWIRAKSWWPYQRPNFVTPPFAGYVSGHSTYSRCAADTMTYITGDPYFPGGMGIFEAPKNNFLVFEKGPSVDIQLQWATYSDAADECSISRIYGGIHPSFDDIPGRFMGAKVAGLATAKANDLWRDLEWWEIPSQLITFIVIVCVAGVAFIIGAAIAGYHLFKRLKRVRQGWNVHIDETDNALSMTEMDTAVTDEEEQQPEPVRTEDHDPELE